MKQQFILYFILLSSIVQAQKHDNIWHVGHEFLGDSSTRINFTPQPISINVTYRNMPMFRSSATVCDSLGSLQFYTNGIWINNTLNQLMQNGDSLNTGQVANDFRTSGYSVSDGCIIIPHPKQTHKYYLFHQSVTYASVNAGLGENLYYTLVDMNANSGLGRVELKNKILETDSISYGQLEVVRHGNGKDWWLVQSMGGSNGFYTFLVMEDTIIPMPKQYIGNNNRDGEYCWTGQAVFSPDGTKYARYDYKNDLDIFDFDRCTGILSNSIHIPIQDTCDTFPGWGPAGGAGVAISPNGQYLYVSSLTQIYQFDLWAPNIPLSKTTVAVYDGFSTFSLGTSFGYLQLAPNGKIYGYANNTQYLHVINFPDLGGLASGTQQHSVFLHYFNGPFLPNFPHYRTPALVGSACDTLTSVVATVPKEAQNIKLYPNPATNSITLESSSTLVAGSIVVIYNAVGQEVFQQKISRESAVLDLDIRSLIDGVYIVQIQKDRQSISKVFVVSKK